MSFSLRALRCDHLDSSIIPLRQLAAGHFMLPWSLLHGRGPTSCAGGDWVKMVFWNCKFLVPEWVSRKMSAQGIKTRLSKQHEHLLTEQSMQAADVKFSGIDRTPSVGPVVQDMSRAQQARDLPDNFLFDQDPWTSSQSR